MDPSDPPRTARFSAGEWLFQLTTITIGVLIALSFDAVLRWNADRTLVAEARATLASEIDNNRRELEAHLTAYDDRVQRLDKLIDLLAALEAGATPTVSEISLEFGFPSLADAGWETAERTGSLALMAYDAVQRLAHVYALQSMVTGNVTTALLSVNKAASAFNVTDDPFALSPAARQQALSHALDVRAHLALDQQLSAQLLDRYKQYQSQEEAL